MTQTPDPPVRNPPGPELIGQIGAVLADLPRFLTAPLYRRWHLRWGATPEEVASSLPGDELLPSARFVCTRAVTIAAPPAAVWPWLVQVGCGRAGWYSHDLLDNLARPSAPEDRGRAAAPGDRAAGADGSRCAHGNELVRPGREVRPTGGCCGASRTAPGRGG